MQQLIGAKKYKFIFKLCLKDVPKFSKMIDDINELLILQEIT